MQLRITHLLKNLGYAEEALNLKSGFRIYGFEVKGLRV